MTRLLTIAALAIATTSLSVPAFAADTAWKVDPSHSSSEFAIKHFALSNVKGSFPVKSGAIALADGKDIPTSVDAVLDASGVNTSEANRDKDLRSANWFDTDKYPTVTFKSTKISGTDPGKFTIVGDLTLHGVTKPVTLEAHFEGRGQGGRGEKRVAYSAITSIHRKDFALIDSRTNALGALVVGDDAAISISIEAISQ